eukprot:Rmarinus@m.20997
MIFYDSNEWYGLRVLLRVTGSVLPRVLPKAALAAFLVILIHLSDRRQYLHDSFGHPYSHQVFSVVVGFIMVFRSNMSYHRFWEGRGHLQTMSSKWADAALQIATFDRCTNSTRNAVRSGIPFRKRILHLMSLLHAVSMQFLQGDVSELVEDDSELPAVIDSVDTAHAKERAPLMWERKKATIMQSATPNKRLGVVGGISEFERDALCAVEDRQYLVMMWVNEELCARYKQGGLGLPAPLLTRIFQELSNGTLGYNQAVKIVETPFPFPYTQLISVLLLIMMLTTPVIVASYVEDVTIACFFTFFAVMGYYALNEVAMELEDPFGEDPNDLPMELSHEEFNQKCMTLLALDLPDCLLYQEGEEDKAGLFGDRCNGDLADQYLRDVNPANHRDFTPHRNREQLVQQGRMFSREEVLTSHSIYPSIKDCVSNVEVREFAIWHQIAKGYTPPGSQKSRLGFYRLRQGGDDDEAGSPESDSACSGVVLNPPGFRPRVDSAQSMGSVHSFNSEFQYERAGREAGGDDDDDGDDDGDEDSGGSGYKAVSRHSSRSPSPHLLPVRSTSVRSSHSPVRSSSRATTRSDVVEMDPARLSSLDREAALLAARAGADAVLSVPQHVPPPLPSAHVPPLPPTDKPNVDDAVNVSTEGLIPVSSARPGLRKLSIDALPSSGRKKSLEPLHMKGDKAGNGLPHQVGPCRSPSPPTLPQIPDAPGISVNDKEPVRKSQLRSIACVPSSVFVHTTRNPAWHTVDHPPPIAHYLPEFYTEEADEMNR